MIGSQEPCALHLGQTPLYNAAAQGYVAVAELLLSHRARVDHKDFVGGLVPRYVAIYPAPRRDTVAFRGCLWPYGDGRASAQQARGA